MKAYFLVSSSYSDPKNCASNIQSRSSVLTSIACIDERLVVADVITRNRLYNEAVDFPMDRTAVKRTSFDEEERTRPSLVYWLSRPTAERIAAVEFLRQQFNGSRARLRRIYRIVDRARG